MSGDGLFAGVLEMLLEQHGPQGWWPADGQFEIMAGAVLVQRTVWRNAARAIERLKANDCLAEERIANLDAARLEALIRPAGFYRVKSVRLKALAQFVLQSGGLDALSERPTEALRDDLLAQPGIGAETADAILAYAFERPVFVVDAYARRLFARLGFPGPPPGDAALKAGCEAAVATAADLNELHALIVTHGQQCCASAPRCARCSLRRRCGYAAAPEKASISRPVEAGTPDIRREGPARRARADTGTGP